MSSTQQDITKKWQRHFKTTKTTISVAFMVFGALSIFVLTALWPMHLIPSIFNSKLAFHIVIDIEDYFSCSKDYNDFVSYVPSEEDNLLSIYLFNVTNAADVFQRGNKPTVAQVGPYGFRKQAYKYDVSFDSQSLSVQYKEYSVLQEVSDPSVCTRIYFRMDRSYVTLSTNPCANGVCDCQPYEQFVNIVNPMFLKLLQEETPFSIISYYAADVFKDVKYTIEELFPTAVRSHLVTQAFQEIYIFRLQMQIGILLNSSYEYIRNNYTKSSIVEQLDSYNSKFILPKSCGLSQYGISTCPFFDLSNIINTKKITYHGAEVPIYPSVAPLLDSSNPISFLNEDIGLPTWLALMYYQGYVDLGFDGGYTTIYGAKYAELYDNMTLALINSTLSTNTSGIYIGSKIIVDSVIQYLASDYYTPFISTCTELVNEEFLNVVKAVPCNPLGLKCVWTLGYVYNHQNLPSQNLSSSLVSSLINQLSKIDSNPVNIQYDGNTIPYYNSYTFCKAYNVQYYAYNDSYSKCPSTNLSYTVNDAIIGIPAGLWGVDYGVSGVNRTIQHALFLKQSDVIKFKYFALGCNISSLLHQSYRDATNFHDVYVIDYINKNKNSRLSHTFKLNSPTVWKEIGWAQWGGGFITDLLVGVKTIYQIYRDGMWYFGDYLVYSNLYEYSSWAILSGFPQASQNGVDFRSWVSYISTTYIGNGQDYVNGVGAIGDKTFTLEANTGNFSCIGRVYERACSVINTFVTSSADYCIEVQSLYTGCLTLFFQNNKFVTNCNRFETSLTAPLNGIVCDRTQVYGHPHNYTKSRGNIVSNMVYTLTKNIRLTEGLWCESSENCLYNRGGMFITSSVRKILFEGFSDPSVVQYLNIKYKDFLHFSCVNNPYDSCGNELFNCDSDGIILSIKNSSNGNITERLKLKYGETLYPRYFTPRFKVTSDGRLLWPNASIYDSTTVQKFSIYQQLKQNASVYIAERYRLANSIYLTSPNFTIVEVLNPIWAAYPAWNVSGSESSAYIDNSNLENENSRVAFLKYIQCQKRLYFGEDGLFNSCIDELNTGRGKFNETLNVKSFHGNTTIHHFVNSDNREQLQVNGTPRSGKFYQYESHGWQGFKTYPYSFLGRNTGSKYNSLQSPRLFDKLHTLSFELDQEELIYDYQRDIIISYPLTEGYVNVTGVTSPSSLVYSNITAYTSPSQPKITSTARRFTESSDSWNNIRSLGIPKDSYGMNYTIPIGMGSLQTLTGLPLFIGTPHGYGNRKWGGTEYSQVTGYTPDQFSQFTFVDYDPVTGRGFRNAIRQQLHLRVEASVLFPNAFQSQKRCIPPTRLFAEGTGYGCFTYIPLLWFEDANILPYETYSQTEIHYYSRPDRAYKLILAGVTIGLITIASGLCLYLNEVYYHRKFANRVYVD